MEFFMNMPDLKKIRKDLGEYELAKIIHCLNVIDISDEDLVEISPDEGDYFVISINGNVNKLPTGVALHLSEEQIHVLRNSNMLEGKE
jgi:hypothetical protein